MERDDQQTNDDVRQGQVGDKEVRHGLKQRRGKGRLLYIRLEGGVGVISSPDLNFLGPFSDFWGPF